MKRLLHIFLVVSAFCVFSCTDSLDTPEYRLKKKELMRIGTMLKEYHSVENESGIDSLVKYFEKKGTDDDRLLAHYYQGYYLFANKEWGSAYKSFVETYKESDQKATAHCEEVQRGLYSVCVLLCIRDKDSVKAKEWLELAERSEVFSDFRYSIELTKASLALYKHQDDSCIKCLDRAFEDIKHRERWAPSLSWCLNEQARMLAIMGRTADFKKRYDLLLQHPFRGIDATTDFGMGLFYAQEGIRDSSLFFYRRVMQSEDTELALQASVQLAVDARNHGENDSVFKYFQECVTLYDRLIDESQNSYSRRLEAAYRNQELKSELAEQKVHLLTMWLCIVIVILAAFLGWTMTLCLKKRLRFTTERLENIRNEKVRLESDLKLSLEKIELLEKQQPMSVNPETLQHFEHLRMQLKQIAASKCAAPHQLCNEFLCLFAELHHGVIKSLQQSYVDIKPTDLLLCVFVSCGFGLSEVACIINHDRQEIRQFMLRISKGLSGRSVGRIKEFKALLDKYFD